MRRLTLLIETDPPTSNACEVLGKPGGESAGNEDEDELQADPRATIVPELPFNADTTGRPLALGLKSFLRDYRGRKCLLFEAFTLKLFLVATFGPAAARSSGTNGFDALIKYQKDRTMNRPTRKDGTVVELRDPGQMVDEDLIYWRDHLLYSFTEGTGCKHPFMFISKGGEPPKLKALRSGSAQVKSNSAKKGSLSTRRGRGRGSKGNIGSRSRKAAPAKKSNPTVEDTESEAVHTDDEGKSIAEPAAASKVETRPVISRPKPRPAVTKKPEALVTAYSMTLQLPEMQEGSTLVSAWKVRTYQWKKVSFYCSFGYTLQLHFVNKVFIFAKQLFCDIENNCFTLVFETIVFILSKTAF